MIPNHGGFVWHSAQQKLTLTGGHVIFWVMEGYYNSTAASTMPTPTQQNYSNEGDLGGFGGWECGFVN